MLSDLMWKIEDWQLYTRIQGNQFIYLFKQFLWIWLVSVCGVIMMSCNEEKQRSYATTWVLASTTWFQQVAYKGDLYNREKMLRYLNRSVYGETLKERSLWVLKVSVIPTGMGCIAWLLWLRKPTKGEEHIRGAEILAPEELRRRVQKLEASGIDIGGIPIPKELDHTHYLVEGASGSGKSNLITGMLEQAAAMGEIAIVFDIEGVLASMFYTPERGDKIINPLDKRGERWSPWAECETSIDMEAEAASLFPITPEIEHTPAGFYRATGRTVYAALLERLTPQDPRLIPQYLAKPDELVKLLAGTDAAAQLGTRPSRERQQILTGMINATRAFRYLEPGPHTWSAREWVKNREGWLFFTVKESQKAVILPFLALCLDALSRRLLDAELKPSQTTRLVIDELAGLPPLETLPNLLRRMRKRGMSITIGFQEIAGLNGVYGSALTASMLNAESTRVLMRGNDAETNEWCARDIGEGETQRRSQSRTAGPDNIRDSVHLNIQQRTEEAVLASQFRLLNPGQAYLTVGQYGTSLVTLPLRSLPTVHPAFVPRDLTVQPTTPGQWPRRRI